MKYLIIFFSFFVFKVSAQDTPLPVKKDDCKAKVSFGSPGTGIDTKTYDAVKAMIEQKKLKFTEKPIGREGEVEICLPLNELKKSKRKKFINQLKKTAASGQYVSVSAS